MSDKAFEIAEAKRQSRKWKVRGVGVILIGLSAGLTIFGELVAGMVAMLGAILWIGTQERIGVEVGGVAGYIKDAVADIKSEDKKTLIEEIKKGFSELTMPEVPDFSQFQAQSNSMAEAMNAVLSVLPRNDKGELVPLLESISSSMQGMKGAEVRNLKKAAKFIKDNLGDGAKDEFLEDVEAGIPEAVQVFQLGNSLAEMLPALEPDSRLAAYGEHIIKVGPHAYTMWKRRTQSKSSSYSPGGRVTIEDGLKGPVK